MTLKEGISMLMSSDATNNALIHESWSDGRYIQCAPLNKDNQVRIRVFSRLDENLKYTEEPFRRKDFAKIKDFGWHIISPEGIVVYALKQVTKKEIKDSLKKDLTSLNRETYGTQLPDELRLQVISLVEDWADENTDNDNDFNLIMNRIDEFISQYQSEYDLYKDVDHVGIIYNQFIDNWIVKYIDRNKNVNLYRRVHNLGLAKADLEWVHKMELENGILVDVDDLEDFDNTAAVSVVKKRIRNALEKKK
jgi:hypothetical protein